MLKVNGYGIDSMARFFLDYGYTAQEELRFPAKKLRALWFSPPKFSLGGEGSGVHGPLPRIFISELLVDQMSPQTQVSSKECSALKIWWQDKSLVLCTKRCFVLCFFIQEIIRKYVGVSGNGNNYAAVASALGTLTWDKPLHSEFQQLAR